MSGLPGLGGGGNPLSGLLGGGKGGLPGLGGGSLLDPLGLSKMLGLPDPSKLLQGLLSGKNDGKNLSAEDKQKIGQEVKGLELPPQIKQLFEQLGIPGFVSKSSGAGHSQNDSFASAGKGGGSLLDPLGIASKLGVPTPDKLLGGAMPAGQFLSGIPGLKLFG